MTRGQDSLVIDILADDALVVGDVGFDASQLIVVAAAPDEIAAHEAVLDAIAKEARQAVWRNALKLAA
jgi:hypothetical protein